MSFRFPGWVAFAQESVHQRVTSLLEDTLNKKDNKLPPILVDKISVKDLSLGSTPPQLEILELGDIAQDQFRGIFKLNYIGDASISLSTRVEANPLNVYSHLVPSFSCPQFGYANKSLTIPLILTLSKVKLNGIVIVVFSKDKGLTLVFRNDPLESITVSSTFDSITPIARFLQVQIEAKLRGLFQDELPVVIHKLSQSWSESNDISSLLYHQYKNQHQQQSITTTPSPPPPPPPPRPLRLGEINPDVPAFSLNNRQKLHTLYDCHQTLSLNTTPTSIIQGATYRSTPPTSTSTSSSTSTTSSLLKSRPLKRRVIKLSLHKNHKQENNNNPLYAPIATAPPPQEKKKQLSPFFNDTLQKTTTPPPAYNE